MEHFQTEENQQNRPLMHQDLLNTSSGNDEIALGKNISFDHYKLLLYVVLIENKNIILLVMVKIIANQCFILYYHR